MYLLRELRGLDRTFPREVRGVDRPEGAELLPEGGIGVDQLHRDGCADECGPEGVRGDPGPDHRFHHRLGPDLRRVPGELRDVDVLPEGRVAVDGAARDEGGEDRPVDPGQLLLPELRVDREVGGEGRDFVGELPGRERDSARPRRSGMHPGDGPEFPVPERDPGTGAGTGEIREGGHDQRRILRCGPREHRLLHRLLDHHVEGQARRSCVHHHHPAAHELHLR